MVAFVAVIKAFFQTCFARERAEDEELGILKNNRRKSMQQHRDIIIKKAARRLPFGARTDINGAAQRYEAAQQKSCSLRGGQTAKTKLRSNFVSSPSPCRPCRQRA